LRAAGPPPWVNWFTLAIACVCLGVGIAVGGLMARARYNANLAVAAVNGVVIDQNQFYHFLENKAGPAVLRAMATDELKYQYAKQLGVAPTDADINRKAAELSKSPDIAAALAQNRINTYDLHRQARASLVEEAVLTHGINVTDDEVRRFYQANIDHNNPTARFYTPESVRVEVLITRTKARADEASRALTDKTMSWETAVDRYSEDKSKLNGGLLPPIQKGRSVNSSQRSLENTLFSLPAGDTTEPKPFVNGWWIIRCLDRTPATTLPFDRVRDQCVLAAKLTKLDPATRKKIGDGFTEYARKATVQAFWTNYKEAINFK
jgi:parvulin-like peptidyl-prolyl isomerase